VSLRIIRNGMVVPPSHGFLHPITSGGAVQGVLLFPVRAANYNNRYRKEGDSFLHDIWNPWHGCVKCSEGCQNCYMYFLDPDAGPERSRDLQNEKRLFLSAPEKTAPDTTKIQSGEQIRVCMTSDFFLEASRPVAG